MSNAQLAKLGLQTPPLQVVGWARKFPGTNCWQAEIIALFPRPESGQPHHFVLLPRRHKSADAAQDEADEMADRFQDPLLLLALATQETA